LEDMEAVPSPGVGVGIAHSIVKFGGHKHAVAPPVHCQRLAGDLLADAPAVDVGGVEEVDARLHRPVHDTDRVLFAGTALGIPPVHASQAQHADLNACTP